jgi:hypothetical protein
MVEAPMETVDWKMRANPSIQRTRASRLAQCAFVAQRRLARAADAARSQKARV